MILGSEAIIHPGKEDRDDRIKMAQYKKCRFTHHVPHALDLLRNERFTGNLYKSYGNESNRLRAEVLPAKRLCTPPMGGWEVPRSMIVNDTRPTMGTEPWTYGAGGTTLWESFGMFSKELCGTH